MQKLQPGAHETARPLPCGPAELIGECMGVLGRVAGPGQLAVFDEGMKQPALRPECDGRVSQCRCAVCELRSEAATQLKRLGRPDRVEGPLEHWRQGADICGA